MRISERLFLPAFVGLLVVACGYSDVETNDMEFTASVAQAAKGVGRGSKRFADDEDEGRDLVRPRLRSVFKI